MKKITFLLIFMIISFVQAQGDYIHVHTADGSNSVGNVTYIDHPELNGDSNAGLVATHVYVTGRNNKVTGLWYDSVASRWTIFNEDGSPMINGSVYNVYIAREAEVIVHTSNGGNQGSFGPYTTVIDDPNFNGSNPGPYAIFTNYWNPFSIYNNQNYGFYYDTALDKRAIYQESAVPIPNNASFKILVSGSGAGVERFTHTATAANISADLTVIDHPTLNGNPDATFVLSHFWGVNGPSTQVDIDKTLGVYYNGSNWGIYTEDASPFIENTAFDIIIAPNKSTLGLGDNQQGLGLSVYPNPAQEFTNIEAFKRIEHIEIYNILGQKVYEVEPTDNRTKVDLSKMASGTYIVKTIIDNTSNTTKLIKQ